MDRQTNRRHWQNIGFIAEISDIKVNTKYRKFMSNTKKGMKQSEEKDSELRLV